MNLGLLTLLLYSFSASFISNFAYSADLPTKIVLASPKSFLSVNIGKNILKVAYQRIGVDVQFLDLPAKRSVAQANQGELDGEVNRVKGITESFPNLVRVPTPINYIDRVLYSTRKIAITSCKELANYRVGIRRGVKHAEKCSEYAREVIVFNDPNQMMKVLNKERIDFVIDSRLSGKAFENNKQYPKIMLISPPLGRSNLYHYLHKSNTVLIDKLDKVLSAMLESGELEEIREQTILDHLQSPNPKKTK